MNRITQVRALPEGIAEIDDADLIAETGDTRGYRWKWRGHQVKDPPRRLMLASTDPASQFSAMRDRRSPHSPKPAMTAATPPAPLAKSSDGGPLSSLAKNGELAWVREQPPLRPRQAVQKGSREFLNGWGSRCTGEFRRPWFRRRTFQYLQAEIGRGQAFGRADR